MTTSELWDWIISLVQHSCAAVCGYRVHVDMVHIDTLWVIQHGTTWMIHPAEGKTKSRGKFKSSSHSHEYENKTTFIFQHYSICTVKRTKVFKLNSFGRMWWPSILMAPSVRARTALQTFGFLAIVAYTISSVQNTISYLLTGLIDEKHVVRLEDRPRMRSLSQHQLSLYPCTALLHCRYIPTLIGK